MRIYSIHFNRPSFIPIQYESCKNLGHELIVVNNGKNKLIHEACRNLRIQEIPTENIGTLSHSHGNAINQLFKINNAPEDCGIIDHDVFLKKSIDFKDSNIVGLKQNRKIFNYLWPGFLFWKKCVNMKLVNFLPCRKADTGANTSIVYERSKSKTALVEEKHIRNGEKPIHSHGFSELYLHGQLVAIHAINGSNWHSEYCQSKVDLLLKNIQT